MASDDESTHGSSDLLKSNESVASAGGSTAELPSSASSSTPSTPFQSPPIQHARLRRPASSVTRAQRGRPLSRPPSASSRSRTPMGWLAATAQLTVLEWFWIAVYIFGGCCSNVFILELIISELPKSTTLVTFFQFLFVSLEGIIIGGFVSFHIKPPRVHPSLRGYIPREVLYKDRRSLSHLFPFSFSLKPRVIPIYHWIIMVLLFWSVSVMNNWALDFKIGVPLHIVFKSGSLLVNMLMGYLLFSKRYATDQVISVILVTAGVLISTYRAASTVNQRVVATNLGDWFTGIGLLSTSLLLSCFLGLYQESTYKKYGKQWREGLFYTHFLGLPLFLFIAKDIWSQARTISQSPPFYLSDLLRPLGMSFASEYVPSFLSIPRLWLYILFNSLTQYICISGVHQITSVTTSLTVNLVLTFRKFISLLLSVYYFSNQFDGGHAIGTALVFIGMFWYSVATTRKIQSSHVRLRRASQKRK